MSVSHRMRVPLDHRDRNQPIWTLFFVILLIAVLVLASWTAWVLRERGTPDFSITQMDSYMATNPELCVARRYNAELAARAAEAKLAENPELKALAYFNVPQSVIVPRHILAVNPEMRYFWYQRDPLAVNPELKAHYVFQSDQ